MLASVVGLVLAATAASAQEAPRPLPPLPPAPWQAQAPAVETLRPPAPMPVASTPVRTLLFHKPAGAARLDRDVQRAQGFRGPLAADVEQYQAQLEIPTFERLIRLESEEALRERMRQEDRDRRVERAAFPEDRPLPEERATARAFPRQRMNAEPNYVCYKRLWFEERNAERYGWDLGAIQPVLSAAYFYADWVTVPYHWGQDPHGCCESGAGECLPGDPVPYLLYPPGLSAKGALAQAGAVLGLVAIFP